MQSILPIWDYLNAIYRYRLVVVCTMFVGVVLTATTVRTLPDVYTSTTLIKVEPQDVPEAYVRATITDRLENRLKAMNQEVLSRTRLEAIIGDLNLYPEARARQVPMEAIVAMMRARVQVQVFPADNAFRISYDASDPKTVQQVTARLAGMYIDENLRMREEHATGTTEFLDGELSKAKRHLEEQETAIQGFKQKYMGELPEQRGTNMQALDASARQLDNVRTALSAAYDRKIMLDRQAGDLRSLRAAQAATDDRPPLPGGASARLQQLEATLSDLRSRYTDEHPDVVQTQNQMARLRQGLGTGVSPGVDPLLPTELVQAMANADSDIKRLKQEEERLLKAIEVYQQRVENAFIREQEMQQLTRDYDVTRGKYQRLLDKKLEAQLSQSLERRQKAERFRILDPASYPQVPSKPNRPMLFLGGLALSLGAAFGIPILLWLLDSSFHVPEELSTGALPVLAVIPQLETKDINRRHWRYRLQVVGAAATVLILGLATRPLYANIFF